MTPIFIDIDGTLLNSEHELTDRTREVLYRAYRSGFKIVLCSGRCYDGLVNVLSRLPFKPYTSTLNGAFILDDEERLLSESYFETEDVFALERLAAECGTDILFFFGKDWGSPSDNASLRNEESIVNRKGQVIPLEELTKEHKVHKLLAVGDGEELRAFYEKSREMFPSFEISFSSPRFVEVNTAGVNKGMAATVVSKALGTDIKEAYCFGDHGNDIEMFRVCGFPIAMGNAIKEVKEIAYDITLTNDEDGLAVYLERLLDEHNER